MIKSNTQAVVLPLQPRTARCRAHSDLHRMAAAPSARGIFADLGKTFRSVGQAIDKVGQGLEASGASASYVERRACGICNRVGISID